LRSRFPVFYKNPGDPAWTQAFSVDLSTSGIGILTHRTLEKDSMLELRLGIPGSIRKIVLRGRMVHQMPAKGKSAKFFSTGIRFEEVPENILDMITKSIFRQLNMTGARIFVLLAGCAAFGALLFRFFYYSTLGAFQGTTFGREWLNGVWGSFPADRVAYLYLALAVLTLVVCFCFFCKQRRASWAVFMVASVGLLDQGIRCSLKIPCLLQGIPNTWLFLAETGALVLWGSLVWAMLRHGRSYEQVLESMREDIGFKPAPPEPPPPPKKPPVNQVFLP
jgi:hypothetical protein